MAWSGQVKDLEDVRSFAKVLLDETGDLFWTQAEQNALANEANRVVFRELVATNPEYFISDTTGPFTWSDGTESVSLDSTAFLGSGILPYKIIGVESTPRSAVVGKDNLPLKWRPMRFADRYMVERSSGWVAYHYVIVRNKMYVSPIPKESLNVHIYWIPHIADIEDDDHIVLSTPNSNTQTNGAAQEFGDLVGVYLAKLMNSKQQGQNPTIEQLWVEGLGRMQNNAQLRNVDEPMSVRVTRGPWE
jgi:hypothetical protein